MVDPSVIRDANGSSIGTSAFTWSEILDTLEKTGICVWMLDPTTGRVYVSESSRVVLGRDPAELTDFAALQAIIHPDDRARRAASIDHALRLYGRYDIELRILHPEGVRWVRSRGQFDRERDTGRACLRGVVFAIDKEKRIEHNLRAKESQLRAVLDTAQQARLIVDAAGIIRLFTGNARSVFRYEPEDVVGQSASLILRGFNSSTLEFLKQLATKERKDGARGRGIRSDGVELSVQVWASLVRWGNDDLFSVSISDTTEQEQTDTRLKQLYSELAHVSRVSAMGVMASALAHELSQPLGAISNLSNAARLMLNDPRTSAIERVRTALGDLAAQALRAGQIVQRMRDFVSQNETERQIETVGQLIEDACAIALVGAREQGVTVTIDHDPRADTVMVDRIQIQQVLVNLIHNAREEMMKGPLRHLTITIEPPRDGMVRITVADTGPGIADAVADTLFDPFVTTKAAGMGLGLSLSRSIIEAHGGQLWAEDNEENGASFRLTIPIASEKGMSDGD